MKPGLHSRPVKSSPAVTRQPTAEERRRAQRVLLKMAIVLHIPGKPAPVEGATHTVSATGAMIVIKDPLTEGTKISLENPKTNKTVDAKVVRPPQMTAEGYLFPIEFLSPAPEFWSIVFPPALN